MRFAISCCLSPSSSRRLRRWPSMVPGVWGCQRTGLWRSAATRSRAIELCPCGHAGDPTHPCTCPIADVAECRARLSGPLADRNDLHVHVPLLRSRCSRRAIAERSQPNLANPVEDIRFRSWNLCEIYDSLYASRITHSAFPQKCPLIPTL